MSYIHPQHSRHPWTRVGISIGAVLALHLALAYALIHGFTRPAAETIQSPLIAQIVEIAEMPPPPITPPTTSPQPPSPPHKQAVTPPAPSHDVRPDTPPPPDTLMAIRPESMPVDVPEPVSTPVPVPPQPVAQPVTPPTRPARTTAVPDSHCEKPQYPRDSLRASESGTVVLQFLIATDGTIVASNIERSSGFRRLDEAARRALSLCRFKPGTEDGRPVQSWAKIQYLWKLEDE